MRNPKHSPLIAALLGERRDIARVLDKSAGKVKETAGPATLRALKAIHAARTVNRIDTPTAQRMAREAFIAIALGEYTPAALQVPEMVAANFERQAVELVRLGKDVLDIEPIGRDDG